MGTKKQTGFTIIEVLIVIVIAGLILAIVLVAVSQLQRSQRDVQRREFASKIPVLYVEYFKNNRSYPDTAAERNRFINDYIVMQQDPKLGTDYTIDFKDGKTEGHGGVPPVGTIHIMQYHWCNRGSGTDGTNNPIAGDDIDVREIVVLVGTEAGRYACVDVHQ